MATIDPDSVDRTNDALDALTGVERGHDPARMTSDPLDPVLAATVRRLRALDSAGAPDTDLTNHIWEDLMSQTASAGTLLPQTRLASPITNGRVGSPPRWTPVPRAAETRPRRTVPLTLLAALLVLSLAAGYARFGPTRLDDGGPANIPAGSLATTVVTPTEATPFPIVGHPLIGTWQMLGSWQAASDTDRDVWSFGDNGKFGSFETFASRVCVGTWQPTGEWTADLVFILQGVASQDLLDPDHVAGQLEVDARFEIWHISVTVDETGNTMSVDGEWTAVMNGTPQAREELVQLTGTRMSPVLTTSTASEP